MPELVSARAYSDVECNFKSITRNVLSVASSLSSAKDVRDFFVLSVEKIVEPLKAMGLEKQEVKLGRQTITLVFWYLFYRSFPHQVEMLLKSYTGTVSDKVLLVDEGVARVLVKFMDTLIPAVLAMY